MLKVKNEHDDGALTTKTVITTVNENNSNSSKDIQGVAMNGPASRPASQPECVCDVNTAWRTAFREAGRE